MRKLRQRKGYEAYAVRVDAVRGWLYRIEVYSPDGNILDYENLTFGGAEHLMEVSRRAKMLLDRVYAKHEKREGLA